MYHYGWDLLTNSMTSKRSLSLWCLPSWRVYSEYLASNCVCFFVAVLSHKFSENTTIFGSFSTTRLPNVLKFHHHLYKPKLEWIFFKGFFKLSTSFRYFREIRYLWCEYYLYLNYLLYFPLLYDEYDVFFHESKNPLMSGVETLRTVKNQKCDFYVKHFHWHCKELLNIK
jgi:hypothetical protein